MLNDSHLQCIQSAQIYLDLHGVTIEIPSLVSLTSLTIDTETQAKKRQFHCAHTDERYSKYLSPG